MRSGGQQAAEARYADTVRDSQVEQYTIRMRTSERGHTIGERSHPLHFERLHSLGTKGREGRGDSESTVPWAISRTAVVCSGIDQHDVPPVACG